MTEVRIDGRVYFKGSATGQGNNCLIDALRQAIDDRLPCVANMSWVRQNLLKKFPRHGESAVTAAGFLDLRMHGAAIVNLIGESARWEGLDTQGQIHAHTFTVVCVEESLGLLGDVVGTGPLKLYLLNEGFHHYVPLLPQRGGQSSV